MNSQVWWYVARAAGIVSWLVLTATVLWGIVLATDLFPDRRRPAWLNNAHRWLGSLSLAFLAIHLGALVADSYVTFDLVDLAVPFASSWKPGPVAAGVIAMWTLVAVQATSLAMRRLSRRVWRGIHLFSYAAFVLAGLHGAFAGTDATSPMYFAGTTASVAAVVFGVGYRVLAPGRGRPRSAAQSQARVKGAA